MKTQTNTQKSPQQVVSEARRRLAESSFEAFCKTYLGHHFKSRPARMHLEIGELLQRSCVERGLRLAIAAPRNHAKSTLISLAFALWTIVFQREPFVVLVSDTADQAQDHLAQIKKELEENERLAADFPELCLANAGSRGDRGGRGGRTTRSEGPSRGAASRWTKSDLELKPTDRAPGGIRILAIGAEQKLRGRRHRSERPSLVICDDLENEELVRSPEQREKRWVWFTSTLMKSGSLEMNTVVAGTVLHHDSLLARLLDPVRGSGWLRRRFCAVERWADRGDLWDKWEAVHNHREEWEGRSGPEASIAFYRAHEKPMLEGTRTLWPEQMDYLRLMQTRARDGRASFATEMQNEPTSPDALMFRDEDFHFWDDPKKGGVADAQQLIARLKQDNHVEILGACDPSLGRVGGAGDYTAIISALRVSKTREVYILGADIRRLRPPEILEAIMENDRIWGYSSFGVETVQFQEMLKQQLEMMARDRGRYFRIRDVRQTTDKLARIQSLVPLIAAGKVKFSLRHTMLLEQLKQFPGGTFDDGPDALEMVVRMAQEPEARWVDLKNWI